LDPFIVGLARLLGALVPLVAGGGLVRHGGAPWGFEWWDREVEKKPPGGARRFRIRFALYVCLCACLSIRRAVREPKEGKKVGLAGKHGRECSTAGAGPVKCELSARGFDTSARTERMSYAVPPTVRPSM